ncbi:hypothetical protein BDM02DRAFT_3259260 [Thelephora ganbajun]|uniref:Uncharacterized protein n=1 Tax=Thelephora ganbajun TaxID=370292 RepID=A0ACB6ZNM7_THEGA|nr:hypothetical protein BDM02DRAFT_3259260 [Thelephora ganbajun]
MKILAMGDRIFFVCETEENVWVVFVAELSPNSVTRFFRLESHLGFDRSKGQFFAVSENGLIVTDPRGICLYHIPELRVVGDNSRLDPVWTWRGDASEFRGSLYKTASPCSALWLQGMQATHALEFDVDESGCFPVVVNHHITEGQPAYYVKDRLKLQGRKGMSIDVERHGEIVFNTGELGKPDLTRQLRAPVPGLNDGPSHKQYDVKYADLDEVTGRIMIVASSSPGRRQGSVPYARRLYIADLPV